MNITKVAPPQTVSGRRMRLSEGDIATLASIVQNGEWASDGQPVRSKSAAYQRAQSAVKVLGERYQLNSIKTSVCLVDEGDENSGFLWSIGLCPTRSHQQRGQHHGSIAPDRSESERRGPQTSSE